MTPWAGLGPASALLAGWVLLSGAPVAVATPTQYAARHAIGAGSLAIAITSIEPAIPEPGDELVVQGTITNDSPTTVGDVAAILRISPTPLADRSEIPEVLAGAGDRTGEPVSGTEDSVGAELEPGASRPFELRAEVDDLGLVGAGVYVTGAEAVGDAGSGRVRQDLDRTFLPWWREDSAIEPLLLTTLWPLTGAPMRDAEGILVTEDTAVEMSPGGRLSTMLDSGTADPGSVSLVVDPESVEAAADLSDGYLVRRPDGSTQPGTRSSEVADWLDRLTTALGSADADAAATLYAWPDLDAAQRGRLLGVLLGQQPGLQAATDDVLDHDLAGPLVLAPAGVAQPSTLAALAEADVSAVVLSDAAAPLAERTFFTPSGNVLLHPEGATIPALLLDSGLSQTLAMPMGTSAEQTTVRQALLAQTLVTAAELPETPRLLVTGPAPTWEPPAGAAEMVVQALTDAPWVTPTSLAAALERDPSSLPRTLVAPSAEQESDELPAAHVARVRAQYRALRSYADVVSDPAVIPGVTSTAPARELGAWFRSHPGPRAALARFVSEHMQALTESVWVVSSGSITVSGASGTIPITIENAGPHPVRVGVQLSSSPPQLFEAEPVEAFTIEPERRTSVEVTAQVAAAGPIPVTIQLVTADGAPFGEPGQLVVESRAYANVARALVRLALAALLIAVVDPRGPSVTPPQSRPRRRAPG